MAAQLLTVTKIGEEQTKIQIKINDGYTLSNKLINDTIQNFRTWVRIDDHIFVWTNDIEQEICMIASHAHIAWIIASVPVNTEEDQFNRYNMFLIDAPCTIAIREE